MKKRPIDRALEWAKAKGMNQSDLARSVGVLPQDITNWKARDLPADRYLSVASALGVSIDSLLGREGFTHSDPITASSEHKVHIQQYDAGGAMGDGVALRDQPGVIQSWTVSKEWLEKNVGQHTGAKNLFIVTGFGDSMRPLFNPGDPLLVDVGVKTVDFDAVYFFRIGDEGFIKRLQRIPTESGLVIRAISENRTAYEPFDITEKMDFEILGRVLKVWCSSEF